MSSNLRPSSRSFWIQIMERLNASDDLYRPIPEILKELCDFFGFGGAIIYQADHTKKFFLRDFYSVYKSDHIYETLDLEASIGSPLMEELSHRKVVYFKAKTQKGALELLLGELFGANSMVLLPIRDQHGDLIAFVGIVDRRGVSRMEEEDFDFTHAVLSAVANHIKLQLYQVRVEAAQKSLEGIMDNMGVDIYVNDFNNHDILYVNRSMAAPYGGVGNLMGKKCWQALYNDKTGQCDYCPQKKLIDEDGNPTKIYSWDYQRPFDGSWFRVLSAAFRWVDGRLAHVVSSVDITENKNNEAIIRQMAEFDPLTGLPNRRKLLQDGSELISRKRAEGGDSYLLFFDLDGFKKVNDTLGHRAGDELLTQIGTFLQESPLTRDRCYRHGGDEFVVVCDRHTPEQLRAVVNSLMERFAQPWRLQDGKAVCGTSIGVTYYPLDGETIDELIHRADMAMYEAKRSGKGSVRFYRQGRICLMEEYF